jgi:glucose/arabinose dehydrogenase/subtilisin-like proprotein convertase family protein
VDGSTLTFGANLIRLRALQTDQNTVPPSTTVTPVGNHNGGKLAVGPDGKLYVAVGDVGRRGWMQNVTVGLLPPSFNSDDSFGGPEPDNAHLTGVVLRLNLNGTAPTDNPFYAAGAALGGQVGANFQKIFSYGHRNGFGLTFDPASGRLWTSENGDDSFDEINAVVAGGNYGWVQAMGPLGRIEQFKTIEANLSTAPTSAGALQQVRFPLSMVANTPAAALAALQVLPGSSYQDPEFSWRYAIAPSGLGFVRGPLLGTRFAGTLWSGMGRTTDLAGGASGTYAGGALMAFRLTGDRQHLDLTADARLADRVADNGSMYPPPAGTSPTTLGFKFDGRESESLLVGQGFGAVTDIQAGPDQALYVVSSTNNAVYRIVRAPAPPTIVPQVAGTQGPSGVYSSAVTVSWSVSDPDFGVTSSTGCGTTTLVDDTPGTTLTCSATNAIGLTATAAVTIAIAQHFTDFPATPGTLGAIPDAPGAGQAGAPRDVTFTVTNLPRVGRVAVSMTFNPAHTASGDLTATLIAPDGTAHAIFARPGTTNDLAGPYRFRDSAVLDFRTAATSGSPVTSGTYRTSTAAGLTVMDGVLGGRAGNGVWTLRFVDHAPGNVGAVAAATLSLAPSLPSNLRVNSVIGNLVQLRWDPPVGVAPPQYIVEGGITPGVPLASFGTGSSAPIFTFAAPSGVFWVRVRAGEVGGQSLPTAAVPLIVGVPVAPSAPEHFTATVAGSALNVSWRNTFGGGAPDTVVVDVTGSAAGTLPLGTSGAVNFGVVPGGSYTLSLRAVNGGGVSPSSNAVSITVPTACSGAPNPPVNFLFYRAGGAVSMLWDPPATGSAPLGYTIEVTGSVNAALPFAGRVLTVPAPPGTYTVRVRADNACGASAFTAGQTVVVP